MLIVLTLVTIIFICLLTKFWSFTKLDYWSKRGVPGPKPGFIFGNTAAAILMRKTDFSHFRDNLFEVDEEIDPLIGKNPFVLNGGKWKDTRTQLLPAFSGEKVKSIIPNVEVVTKRLINFIRKDDNKIFEAKSLSARFTTDNVFSIMYSMDSKSFDDTDAKYWKMTRNFFSPSLTLAIKNILMTLFPGLTSLCKIRFFPRDLNDVLFKLAVDTREDRKKNNVSKNDFLKFLNETRNKTTGYKFSDLDIAAHSAGFVLDGLETTATTLSFLFTQKNIFLI